MVGPAPRLTTQLDKSIDGMAAWREVHLGLKAHVGSAAYAQSLSVLREAYERGLGEYEEKEKQSNSSDRIYATR